MELPRHRHALGLCGAMGWARWSGIAIVACGCGQSTDRSFVKLPEYFGGGSRLLPTVASAEGSPDYLLSWYDSELETPCAFARAADGALRCLPFSSGLVRFADSECVEAFGTPGFFNCPGPFAERAEPLFFSAQSGCATLVLRPSGAPPPTTERSGYFILNEDCRADVEVPVGPESVPLEVVLPSEFVAAQLGPDAHERSPGMGAWTLSADDGAWEIRGFFDPERAEPCASISYSSGASDWCLPSPHEQQWDDGAGCGQPGARATTCGEALTALYSVSDVPFGECAAPRLELFDAEGPERGTTCATSPSDPIRAVDVYRPGRKLDPSTLPRIERMHVGSGRLRLQFQGHGGVPYFPDPSAARPFALPPLRVGYFDTRFDEPCWPQRIGADSFLCLSDAWAEAEPLVSSYGYASCSSDPLEARRKPELPSASCAAPRPPLRGFWSRSGGPAGSLCFDDAGGYQLQGAREYTGGVTYSPVAPVDPEQPPVCDAASTDAELDYFLPGAALEPDRVAEIRVRTLFP